MSETVQRVDMPAELAVIVCGKDWVPGSECFTLDVAVNDEHNDSVAIAVERHWPWNVTLEFYDDMGGRTLTSGEVAMVSDVITRLNEARYSNGAQG